MLISAEKHSSVKYVKMELLGGLDMKTYYTGIDIPHLGVANNESAISCQTFLVAKSSLSIKVGRTAEKAASDHSSVDQLLNPDTVTFTPAGLWKPGILLHGRIATVSGSTASQALMTTFYSTIKEHFTKIKAFWVGRNARNLLDCGKRLTIAEQSPREFDLKI